MALIGIVIVALLLVSGLVLLGIGLRGRVVSTHPHCRRCRFDLVGQATADGVWAGRVCPECGADLGDSGAIRSGLRARRRVPMWCGAGMLLLAGAVAATVVWGQRQGKGLYSHLPTWVILRVMDHVQGDELDLIGVELRARAKAGDLSATEKTDAIAACLRAQADPKRAWACQCGKFVEEERALGVVTDATWLGYMGNAMLVECNARATVVNGDPLPLELVMHDRLGRSGALSVRIRLVDVLLDGKRIDGERQGWELTPMDLWGNSSPPLEPVQLIPQIWGHELWGSIPASPQHARVHAEPGTHTIETVWGVVVADNRLPRTYSGMASWQCLTPPPGPQSDRRSDDEILKQMKIEWVRNRWFNPVSVKFELTQEQASAAETDRIAAKFLRVVSKIEVIAAPPAPTIADAPRAVPIPTLIARRFQQAYNRPLIGPPALEEFVSISFPGTCPSIAADLFELRDGKEVLLGSLCIDTPVAASTAPPRTFQVRMPRAADVDQPRSFVLRPREELARCLVRPEPRLGRPVFFATVPAPPPTHLNNAWDPGQPVTGTTEPPKSE